MRRRKLIAGIGSVAALQPLPVFAQQALPVVGFISGRSSTEAAPAAGAFRRGLAEAGYVDARNVTIDYRWAEGRYDRLPAMAAELVNRKVSVIAATGGAELFVKSATSTIPIVFTTGGDPIGLGLVPALNKPVGNLTGVTFLASGLGAKRLDLLGQISPHASTIAMIMNPNYKPTAAEVSDVEAAAHMFGLQLDVVYASTNSEVETAFAKLERARPNALVVGGDPVLLGNRDLLVRLAATAGLPAIYPQREYVDAGGLMSYGASVVDGYRQVGVYTGKILDGAKPIALPVLQPTKFDLVINLKTAKALGLSAPIALLAAADDVIE